ncbi:uncharacterized protein LOC135951176 [Calliphora vicina]|uniref:uncharacterized protein LOC135951176 n=1 Tax=Calliphora vicina TaxID=7373 RepID=UPI00325BCDEB
MAAVVELSANDVQGLCRRYFKDYEAKEQEQQEIGHDFDINYYKLKPISEDPSGFLGNHRYLIVEISKKNAVNQDSVQKLRFFTKSAPMEIASRMEYMEQFGVFKKEIAVYRDVLPRLQEIFEGIAPKCYYADNNWLVFEDLHQQGYKMGSGRDGLYDREHLKCAVKNLAALHSASLVYEVQQKQKFDELHPLAAIENAYPKNCSNDHVRFQNFSNGVQVFKELIKQMPKYQNNLDFILSNIQNKMQLIFKLVQTSKKYQNVFSHGDLWANNIMFQYSKYGDIPIHSRFVDFQLARYAPPMIDLITILTIPTSREFRSKYLMELIADYYHFMTEFLKREKLNIKDFITEEELYASLQEFRICGLIESCLFSHLTILPSELTQCLTGSADGFTDFFDRKRVEICLKAFHTDETYRTRLTDMLEDLVDNFILVQ